MLLISNLGETFLDAVPLEAEEHVVVFVLNIAFFISLEIPLLLGALILWHTYIIAINWLSL